MNLLKRRGGRPQLKEGKRIKIIKAKLTEDEFKIVQKLEKELGISRMELIRKRVLYNSNKILVNSGQLLQILDELGAEIGKVGSNINQITKHANILNKQNAFSAQVLEEFNLRFKDYITIQEKIENVFRQIIRLMKT